MSLRARIKDGLEGKYQGLSNGFRDINQYIFNVQRKCYTLIGGLSGTYKTTLLDFIILNAITDAERQGIPTDVFYYSFEIDQETKKCNWLSQMAYNEYGVTIPPERIKGLGDNRLSSREQEIIDSLIPKVEHLFSKIKFTFDAVNPTGIYTDVFRHCKENGELLYEPYVDEHGDTKQKIVGYTPKDNRYVLVAMDHLALMRRERNFSLKENMDKMSEYLVALRNIFHISGFIIQQFNQGLSSVDRQKFKGVDISPQQTDFKDTTSPYQDADIVLGTMNAHKMDMEYCLGYDIKILKQKFIMLKIIKNRLSRDGIAKGLLASPEEGRFIELPKPNTPELKQIYDSL
jgi:replicative DNA helicase